MNTDRILKELREGQHIKRVILYYGDQAPSDIIEESDSFKDWDLLLAYLIHTNLLDEKDVISELWESNDHTKDLEDYCNLEDYIINEMYIDYGTLIYLIERYCFNFPTQTVENDINDWYEYIIIDPSLWGKY